MGSRAVIPDLSVSPRFTFEVSPRSRFAGEFASIVKRTGYTSALEMGVERLADEAEQDELARGQSWRDIWDRAEGSSAVAWALLFAEKPLPFSHKQQQVRDFITAHEKFFFNREGKKLLPKRRNIEALWPHIQHGTLPDHWEKTKLQDAYATGEKMAELLRKAGIKPPAWGPGHE